MAGRGEQPTRIGVITLFPQMLDAVTGHGISGRIARDGGLDVRSWNPRDFTRDKHRTVDDRPYGGGPGMVMMAEPLQAAVAAAKAELGPARVVHLSPQGERLTQRKLQQMVGQNWILLAGRYEGIDERFVESCVDEELSLGDYVLSGGELAAMVVIDGIARLLPGALGHEDSAAQDSFSDGLLDCPHYTRPEQHEGAEVPPVLLSGDHAAIRRWRLQQALGRTWLRRPDLMEQRQLTVEEAELLAEFKVEHARHEVAVKQD